MKMLPSFFSALLFSALLFSYLSVVVQAACYYPNGSIAPNDTPCRDDTAESACCGQGYACLSNGMCQATGQELQKGGATELVRGAIRNGNYNHRRHTNHDRIVFDDVDGITGDSGHELPVSGTFSTHDEPVPSPKLEPCNHEHWCATQSYKQSRH
ncbi:hypothetical protein CkaCkLH20_11489 [Colletotrichum karsti]|uniref:Uncharacterized protein n=1 Tax=Colletotrichum karsti TaxID=1095194 RepID=A0A9P6HW41_9PEZI|nr:uncharacterized protein CkaCkLH20_11489 [Colletotrichum karsti]KAF9871072.1 hypothetical protein CkaCkLH20_11489 [Colletotrichum karsti]